MGVRTLEGSWLRERGLVGEHGMRWLAGTRVGIDAQHYLQGILARGDAFLSAVGGSPLGLAAEVERDLHALASLDIKPVFVFSGLQFGPEYREHAFVGDELRGWRRDEGWEHYENGDLPRARQVFSSSVPLMPADVYRVIHRLFKVRSVEFIVAPYLASAQLVYLLRHPKVYVHAVYGASELFMFEGVDRVISHMDFEAKTFTYTSKQALLADINVTPDQFLDVCILSGYDGSPPFPAINPVEFPFRAVGDLVKSRGSGVQALLAFKTYPGVISYFDLFARARCSVKFSLVLVAQEGRVLPLSLALTAPATQPSTTAADVPSDLGEVFSAHFPDEVYYQLFRGLVSPTSLNALASGRITEPAPLCGGTPEYERHVASLSQPPTSPRCVAIGLISSALHPQWSKQKVSMTYYFDPHTPHVIPHASQATLTAIECVANWNVDARFIENELRRQTSSTIDLSLCLGGTSSSKLAACTVKKKEDSKPLDKKDEIVANTLWRFLELRGFLTTTHQHTAYAQALYLAMRSSKINDKFQESLFLAIELIRSQALHSGKIGNRQYSGGPNLQGTDEAGQRSMLLVMRVLSTVPLAFNPGPWTGPLSRELLVFNSFLRVTTRAMRQLLEAITMNMLLRGDARRHREDYLDIALSLPFQWDTNTGMGILFKAYGDAFVGYAGGIDVISRAGRGGNGVEESTEEERRFVEEARASTLKLLEEFFPNVKNVTAELQRGMRFWQIIMLAVRALSSYPGGAIPSTLAQQFEAADAWLKPFAIETTPGW